MQFSECKQIMRAPKIVLQMLLDFLWAKFEEKAPVLINTSLVKHFEYSPFFPHNLQTKYLKTAVAPTVGISSADA